MLRQWLVGWLLGWAWAGRGTGIGLGGIVGAGILGGGIFLEFADQQFELLDLTIELLRGSAEPRTPQRGELHLQLFDVQRLGVDLCGVGGEFDVLARQLGLQADGETAQLRRVGRQWVYGQGHRLNLRLLYTRR